MHAPAAKQDTALSPLPGPLLSSKDRQARPFHLIARLRVSVPWYHQPTAAHDRAEVQETPVRKSACLVWVASLEIESADGSRMEDAEAVTATVTVTVAATVAVIPTTSPK
jgi:hypothetical protein